MAATNVSAKQLGSLQILLSFDASTGFGGYMICPTPNIDYSTLIWIYDNYTYDSRKFIVDNTILNSDTWSWNPARLENNKKYYIFVRLFANDGSHYDTTVPVEITLHEPELTLSDPRISTSIDPLVTEILDFDFTSAGSSYDNENPNGYTLYYGNSLKNIFNNSGVSNGLHVELSTTVPLNTLLYFQVRTNVTNSTYTYEKTSNIFTRLIGSPLKPTNFKVYKGDKKAILVWDASHGEIPVNSYRITYRQSNSNTESTIEITELRKLKYDDSKYEKVINNLTNGVEYTFGICSVNGIGTSEITTKTKTVNKIEGTSSGDPHVFPIYGKKYELPMEEGNYRMIDGEELIINASTASSRVEDEIEIKKYYYKLFNKEAPSKLVTKGVYYDKVFIKADNEILEYSFRNNELNKSSNNYFKINYNVIRQSYSKGNYENDKEIKQIKISFNHSIYGEIEFTLKHFSNPQIKYGIGIEMKEMEDASELSGLLIREYECNSMKIKKLKCTNEINGIQQRNKSKTVYNYDM